MIIIPFIIILVISALKFNGFIRKHNIALYLFFLVLSIVAYIAKDIPIFTPFRQGFLGLSFFYVVMLTGALKDKSKMRIALVKVRMEYSIIGFIIISSHSLKYLIDYFNSNISIPIYGIIVYVIFIPLFITSFKIVRKKFSFKAWKKLQSFAYIAYLILFVHLIIQSEMPNTVVYIIIFIIYLGLKIKYEAIKFKKKKI